MASKTLSKPLSEQQHKVLGSQVVEKAYLQPSPLQLPDPSKLESDTPTGLPESTQQSTPKPKTEEVLEGQNLDHQRKEAPNLSTNETTQKAAISLEHISLDTSSNAMKQSVQQGEANELLQLNGTVTLEANRYEEKKNSGQGSEKYSSASAKVSDGTSSLTKTSGSAKISDRIDSGKSSMCRGSTSSDVSDDSTCSSISSSINKPHKSNDSRWEAIKTIRARDGILGLNHFRLLKKLGCGDIGSVYLSELSGTKCYFAMKVMDKQSLASRKKLHRAQTEREILQCLDHPFLPTLYTHFETDKFSCLVMEFCPGGDLHTLRQRQPGKYFSEQAAK
ncbi:hypothetical protein BHE74_00005805 [Ensete ventricosum]|nr:hypothetical protein BHE74_00005805 [Ensete ventricosum]